MDLDALSLTKLESLRLAICDALVVVTAAERKGIILSTEIYPDEVGCFEYALRPARAAAGDEDEDLPETASEEVGGVAGFCSASKCGENRTGTESETSGDSRERPAPHSRRPASPPSVGAIIEPGGDAAKPGNPFGRVG